MATDPSGRFRTPASSFAAEPDDVHRLVPPPLRAEEAHALRILERVNGGARVVVEELDPAHLAAAFARQLAPALGAERALVAITDEQSVVLRASCVCGEVQDGGSPEDPEATLLHWIAQRRQPYRVNDPAELLPGWGRDLRSLGWRNAVGMPIPDHQGRPLGALLAVDRRDGTPFSPIDQRIGEILALQAAVGFERALLLERLTDWTRGLEALLAFSAAINQHLDPPSLVRHLVEHAARFLKAAGGRAGLLERGPEQERGAVMTSEAYCRGGVWHDEPRSWAPAEGLPGFVLENEFPYLTNDYSHDRLADPLLIDGGVRRALCVPVKGSDGRMVGFFELHRGEMHPPFSWQDAAFLESLANTTSVAIENASLLKVLEAKGEQIRALSAHNVTCLEEERRHIARELHDEAGQALVGVKLGLQVMARLVPSELPVLRDQLDSLRSQVNEATTQIKDLARRLRPPTLDQLGLEVALRQLIAEYGVRADLRVEAGIGPLETRLPQVMETALYRIAQEALTNVAVHARAACVRVDLRAQEDRVRLEVWDDGCGFVPGAVNGGLGLLGMRERVGMLGGHLTIASEPGKGTSIRVEVSRDAPRV